MSISERKLRQKEEVRVSILESAWDLVVSEGWQSLTVRKIADAIEYSVPVIYSHFENKDAILVEFNRNGFKLLVREMLAAKTGQPGPREEIVAMGHAYWDFAFMNREYYQLMFGLGIPTCEAVRKIPEMVDFNEAITSSIRSLTPPQRQAEVDPFLKFQSFWSMLHGLVSINMLGKAGGGGKGGRVGEGGRAGEVGRAQMAGQATGQHQGLSERVLKDVIDSFIKGIES